MHLFCAITTAEELTQTAENFMSIFFFKTYFEGRNTGEINGILAREGI